MNKITPVQLQKLQAECTRARTLATQGVWGAPAMVTEAWNVLGMQLQAAPDDDAKAAIIRKFTSVFLAFGSVGQDLNMLLGEPLNGSPDQRAKRRTALDRHSPALAQWSVEKDEIAADLQRRIDHNAANLAERIRAALSATLLGRIRAAGHDLSLDGKGRLLATPGAADAVVGGMETIREHKQALTVILKAEAEAKATEAARLAPVLV